MTATAGSALREGVRRVNAAPLVVAGTFLVTLLIALPLAIALGSMIEAHLGASLAADAAAASTNYDWWQEFSSQAVGLATTFVPSIIGAGAVLDNLSNFVDRVPLATTVAGAVAAWLVIWSFVSGGVLDRLARARKTRTPGFFAACGTHFWRFLRLGAVAWVVYLAVFEYVHGWIFTSALGALTRETTVERTAFLFRLAGYGLFGVLLVGCNIIFDYARIRIVVEDRRSAIGALAAGRACRAARRGVAGLCALNGLAFLGLVLGCLAGAGRAGRVVDVGHVRNRPGLHSRPPLPEAPLLRVGNGVFSARAGARGLYGVADGRVAGLAGGGSHRPGRPEG